ncbi:hypothetical protein [Hyalangium sp.]|uniref:hypothetical protein n=1 Tax=Hyalangium sp. TaxID=2028555 RepID=UPI002D34D35D|nr:hypothetical protein [Hyalangium sp.]HYI02845.1 hypothetical protein [Hyalangium sp.]
MAKPRKLKAEDPSPPPPASPKDEMPPSAEDDSTQFVSIAAELSAIGRAVDGAVLLTDALAEDAVFSTEAADRIPPAVVAVLGLVHARLDQVQRVLRGSTDPKRILTPGNLTGAPSPEEDPDIRLRVWTHDQRIAFHSREVHMAESEQEAAARQRG